MAKTLTGLDTSAGMLEVFDRKTQQHSNVSSLNLNLEEGGALPSTYDLILSSMAFHHLTSPVKILSQLKKALSPGGRIVIVDLEEEDGSFHPDPEAMGVKHFGFSRETIASWAKENDLQVEVRSIYEMEKDGKSYKQFIALFR